MAKSTIRNDKNPFESLASVAGPLLKVGGRFLFDDVEFEYIGALRGGLHQFIKPATGEALSLGPNIQAVTSEWVTDMIASRRLVFLFGPLREGVTLPQWTIEEIQQRDPAALMRQQILLALDEVVNNGGKCTRSIRQATTVRVCLENPNLMEAFKGIPSDRQVRVWYRTYGEPGRRTLMSCVCLRGRVLRAPKLSETQLSMVRKSVVWYTDNKEANPTSAWDEFNKIVLEHNQKLGPGQAGERVEGCSRSSFFVHFHKEMEGPWLRKKLGERAYRSRFKGLGKGNERFLPGEAYEIDHTVADIFLVDRERGLVIGRPYITSIIDVGSRAIICLYVSFTPPSMASVFEALKIAFSPRGNVFLADKYPALKGVYGIPKRIIADRGPEFTSSSFCLAIVDLGVALYLARVREPEDKPEVERGFRSINEQLIHQLRGVAFFNVDKKFGDYDSEKHATLDLDKFSDILNKFISIYNLHAHEGLGGASPAAVWQEHARYHNPRTFADFSQIGRIAGVSRKRSLSRKGVRVEHIYYGSSAQISDLMDVYRKAKGGKAYHPVRVVSNSLDMGEVEVYCEPSKTFVTLRARDYDYAAGLSLYLHKKIRKARIQKTEALASQVSLSVELSTLRAEARSDSKKATQAKKRDAARLLADIDAKQAAVARDVTVVKPFSAERDDGTAPLPATVHAKRKPRKAKSKDVEVPQSQPSEATSVIEPTAPVNMPKLPNFEDFIR